MSTAAVITGAAIAPTRKPDAPAFLMDHEGDYLFFVHAGKVEEETADLLSRLTEEERRTCCRLLEKDGSAVPDVYRHYLSQ